MRIMVAVTFIFGVLLIALGVIQPLGRSAFAVAGSILVASTLVVSAIEAKK